MNVKVAAVALTLAGTAALSLAGCSAASGGQPTAQASSAPTVSSDGAASSPAPAYSSPAPASSSPAPASSSHAAASGSGSATKKKAGSTDDVITFPPGGAASVTAWYHGRGGMAFTSLTTVLDKATRAKTKGGVTAFGATCDQIGSAARAAQAAPPMPLASVAKVYSSALTQYVTSATQCQQALAAADSKSLNSAVSEVEANSVTLNRAAAVLIAALADG
jgi:hypothetical protein